MNPGVVGAIIGLAFCVVVVVILAWLDISSAPKKDEWTLGQLKRVRRLCDVCREDIPDDGMVYSRPGELIHAACFANRQEVQHARR